jgi:hypothetical protein
MQQNVGITMADQAAGVLDGDSTQDEWPTFRQAMAVMTNAYAMLNAWRSHAKIVAQAGCR